MDIEDIINSGIIVNSMYQPTDKYRNVKLNLDTAVINEIENTHIIQGSYNRKAIGSYKVDSFSDEEIANLPPLY